MSSLANMMASGTDVDLRGAKRRVAEQGLYDIEGFASANQLHRDGVTKRMSLRAGWEWHTSSSEPALYVVIQRRRRQRITVIVEPQRIITTWAGTRALETTCKVGVDGPDQLGRERTVADDVTLAHDANVRILDIEHEIADTNPAQLARANPGTDEDRGEGEVALRPRLPALRILRPGRGENAGDLLVPLDVVESRSILEQG